MIIEVHVYHHDDQQDRRLGEILHLVRQLTRMEEEQMFDLSDLRNDVARQTTVQDSVRTLLIQLSAKIEELKTGDPAVDAELASIAAQVKSNVDSLTADVVAHTPVA